MQRSDFEFQLPERLIAQRPLDERSASRMLCVDGRSGEIADRKFGDLLELLHPDDLLIFNDTEVIPARLLGHKTTGGRVEVLIERVTGELTAWAHVKSSKSPKAGTSLEFSGERATVLDRNGELFELEFETPLRAVLDAQGHMPLPPYIKRSDDHVDQARYQTVYAQVPGAVAAPTAGLHFSKQTMASIAARGIHTAAVTLHVGAGTFQPLRTEKLEDHHMHEEWLSVGQDVCDAVTAARVRGGRVVAVGTTSVRALEFAARQPAGLAPVTGDTDLFLRPGSKFLVVDALLTNFHLPQSTLLMLVCAFAGYPAVMRAYRHAVKAEYRFFSYGDAMFLTADPAARGQGPV